MPTKYIGPPYTGFSLYKDPGEGVWSAARANPSTGQVVFQTGVQGEQEFPEGVWSSAGLRGSFYAEKDGIYTFSAVVNVGPVTMLRRAAHNMWTSVGFTVDEVHPFGDGETFYASGNTVGVYYGTKNFVASKSLKKGNYAVMLSLGTYMDYSGVPSPAPYAEIIATFSSFVIVTPVAAASAKSLAQEEFRQPTGERKLVTREISDIESVTEGFIEI